MGVSPVLPFVLSIKDLKGLEEMKKYQIIGFTLWTLGSIILTLRMWDYLLIAPVLAAQVNIWICCSFLFCVDVSSRGLFVSINTTLVITGLLGFFYFIYYRNPIGAIDIIASFAVIIRNCLCERGCKVNRLLTKILTIFVLSAMLLSFLFTTYIFVTNKKTGLSNGLSCSWSVRDEKFFDEIAKDCTTEEEIILAGYEWIIENIDYDYEYAAFYQYFDIDKTLYTKKGLCYDYANLFASYCRSQGIACFAVDGKHQYDYSRKHTWNRVYFNDYWWDVDTTHDSMLTTPKGFSEINSLDAQTNEYIMTRIY